MKWWPEGGRTLNFSIKYLPRGWHSRFLTFIEQYFKQSNAECAFFYLKGTVSRDFLLRFFHASSSPKSLKITLGSFRIFSKIRGDIRKSRCTMHRCQRHRCTLSCEYLCKVSNKFETALMGYSGAWGNRFMKKSEVENLVVEHCPFKGIVSWVARYGRNALRIHKGQFRYKKILVSVHRMRAWYTVT